MTQRMESIKNTSSPYKLSPAFHADRREKLLACLNAAELDLLMVFNPTNVAYLTGLFHISTERPIGIGFLSDGRTFAIMPTLEIEAMASTMPWLDSADTYFDYPEGNWEWVARCLAKRGFAGKKIGVDMANLVMSADPIEAYNVFHLRLGKGVCNAHQVITKLRLVKHPEEIALFRIASQYTDYLVSTAFSSLRVGITEYEVHEQAKAAVMRRMLAELPEIIETNGYIRSTISGRTLFGSSSSLPHGPTGTKQLKQDSAVMSTYGVAVCSYSGETERTGFFGQRHAIDETRFQVMLEVQSTAIEAIKPGARCCDVWDTVVRVAEKYSMGNALRHHAGHGKGIEIHEPPFLDAADQTELVPGMVISCEPGLYFPGEAGFRLSDTILVTDIGNERLSQYPRDMESLTFDV